MEKWESFFSVGGTLDSEGFSAVKASVAGGAGECASLVLPEAGTLDSEGFLAVKASVAGEGDL